ncbi:MAG: bifunctional homocysteine S-methyltransferase/methylenetetrahydrofolate reductase [Clostridia bacterium]|nr:bifunctional homocysteine S-methyltransferase/methylenetetrahydrofolate reductase [Clostridia bacterium]
MKLFYFDGAFGTLYNETYSSGEACELANLLYPERVLAIHKAYLDVGVNAIKTNTFGANFTLTRDENQLQDIIKKGYQLACDATKNTAAEVFCDIGYIDSEQSREEYLRNVDIFLSLGGRNFIFETLQEYEPLPEVISYLRKKAPTATVLVSFSVSQDGYTKKGYFYKTLLEQAAKDADIVGLNCRCGPAHLYQLIAKLNVSDYPRFSAMPNAGYPQSVNGRTVYSNNLDYYAEKLLKIAALGVSVVGGCCGTTPEHLRKVIDGKIPVRDVVNPIKTETGSVTVNQMMELLQSGKKLLAVEVDPPVNADASFLLHAAQMAKNAGADLITVADSPLARSRADSMLLSAKIKREIGIETMPHLSCRDRNDIAIRSALLGANIEAVNNVLVVTGDPVACGHGGVFQFNSYTLMNLISTLNQEMFQQNPYTICGALNVNAKNFDAELKRAEKKLSAGARVLLTQPIFSEEAAQNFKKAKETLDCYILAGILPIAGWKNARFLNNEVSGIQIPEALIERLKQLEPEEVKHAVVSYSMEKIRSVYYEADGFYIMTPLKKIELVAELLTAIRKLEKEG